MCSDSKGDSEGDFNEQQNNMSASEFEVEEVQNNETHPRRRLLKNGTKKRKVELDSDSDSEVVSEVDKQQKRAQHDHNKNDKADAVQMKTGTSRAASSNVTAAAGAPLHESQNPRVKADGRLHQCEVMIDRDKCQRWFTVTKPKLPKASDIAVLPPWDEHPHERMHHYSGGFNCPIGLSRDGEPVLREVFLPPMAIADEADIATSNHSRNQLPIFSLTGWGFHRLDTANGVIDKNKPALRQFHIAAVPVRNLDGASFDAEWDDALAFVWKAQDAWADHTADDTKARMTMSATSKNVRFQLIESYNMWRGAQPTDSQFSSFIKDRAKFLNAVQSTSTPSSCILKLVRDIQVILCRRCDFVSTHCGAVVCVCLLWWLVCTCLHSHMCMHTFSHVVCMYALSWCDCMCSCSRVLLCFRCIARWAAKYHIPQAQRTMLCPRSLLGTFTIGHR